MRKQGKAIIMKSKHKNKQNKIAKMPKESAQIEEVTGRKLAEQADIKSKGKK